MPSSVLCVLAAFLVVASRADFASMSSSIPRLSNLRAYTSFSALASPLADESGHGSDLATRDGYGGAAYARCDNPPCHVRLSPGSSAGLVAPAGLGQSSNGTTVCIRYRVWRPADPMQGSGVVLRLLPINNDRPSMGSIKYYSSDPSLQTYTVTDASVLYEQWSVTPTADESGAFTHVCLAWLLHGAESQLRHLLAVDTSTPAILCPANNCDAEQQNTPMVGPDTIMCIGCGGFPEANRQSDMDVATFAVWDTALSQTEMRTYIDLVAAQAKHA